MDVGVLARSAIQHRAGEPGREVGQLLHQFKRNQPQLPQSQRLRFAKKQGLVLTHLRFDLRIVGQNITAYFLLTDDQFRRFALGAGVVGTVFGNHARSGSSDLCA